MRSAVVQPQLVKRDQVQQLERLGEIEPADVARCRERDEVVAALDRPASSQKPVLSRFFVSTHWRSPGRCGSRSPFATFGSKWWSPRHPAWLRRDFVSRTRLQENAQPVVLHGGRRADQER